MSDTRICAVIPAYNEAETVVDVIEAIKVEVPGIEVVVINDGSKDETAERAKAAGAKVINLPINLGIGGAVQTGLKYAYRAGYEIVLEIDADGQHDAKYAPAIIAGVELEKADMVIGSRFIKNTQYRSSRLRRFGIHLFSWLIKTVTGQRIYDSTSGFRAYSQRALKFLSQRYPADFPEPESIVMLLNNRFRIKEVAVEMKDRQGGMSVVGASDISLKGVYFVISNAIAIILTGVRTRKPIWSTLRR